MPDMCADLLDLAMTRLCVGLPLLLCGIALWSAAQELNYVLQLSSTSVFECCLYLLLPGMFSLLRVKL